MKRKVDYKQKVDWDDMSYGEAKQHIGKKTTQKVHKSQKDYSRKGKNKRNWEDDLDY